MLKEIFVQTYYPLAKEAGEKYTINPVVILAQAAIESGWAESTLAKKHSNFFGITGYGKPTDYWPGTKVQLSDKGLPFRSYPSEKESFFDFCRLIRSSYKPAADVSIMPRAYAKEISYSRYISEVNGDNRENYRSLLVKLSSDIEKLVIKQFPQ
ncbi:MAG: glucosaminidase domain-containing protein [Prolixibacteraceae bacterium]|jgi:flagellar protein FlgJ|nr:glucosaminidase domain-containing protein [Prolixibacteraceae bacterium]